MSLDTNVSLGSSEGRGQQALVYPCKLVTRVEKEKNRDWSLGKSQDSCSLTSASLSGRFAPISSVTFPQLGGFGTVVTCWEGQEPRGDRGVILNSKVRPISPSFSRLSPFLTYKMGIFKRPAESQLESGLQRKDTKAPRCTSQEDGLRLQDHCQPQRDILYPLFSKTLDTLSKLWGL